MRIIEQQQKIKRLRRFYLHRSKVGSRVWENRQLGVERFTRKEAGKRAACVLIHPGRVVGRLQFPGITDGGAGELRIAGQFRAVSDLLPGLPQVGAEDRLEWRGDVAEFS